MLKDKRNILMIIILLLMIFIQLFMKNQNFHKKSEYYDEMFRAAKKMKILSDEIKNEKIKRNIEIDRNIDKNLTGLIGLEWSEISTTLGDEVAKRTTTNTDFAALMVKKFKELNLQSGDRVGVNMSSSFPALNLALISAVDTLGIEAIIINSVGSSSYGANIVGFDYLDMENHLYEKGLIKNRTKAYSLGGINDVAEEFEEELIEKIKEKNKKYNLEFFYNPDLEKNIEERFEYYTKNKNIKAFINIGGNSLAFGKGYREVDNSDVILKENLAIKGGLVGKFYNSKIPVLHFLNIKGIALKNSIPIDFIGENEIGKSKIYFKEIKNIYFNLAQIILFFIFILYNLFFMKKFSKKS